MKKEIAVAIFIGLLLGLVVTFGIYIARSAAGPSVEKSASLLASSTPGVSASDSPNANSSLVLSSPEDGSITTNKEVQVSGTTQPNSFIFIFYGTEYKMERADSTGNFSTKVTSKTGPVIIIVRALDLAGNVVEEERALFIGNPEEMTSSANIASASASPSPKVTPKVVAKASASAKKVASPTPSLSASASGSPDALATENLKQRIDRVLDQRQEKLRELEKAGEERRLFIGEIQRIIERTVTLKSSRGNESFTITPDLKLVRDNKKASADDFAVGDWVGLIGFSEKETIQPQAVFASSTSLMPSKYATVLGTIKEITRSQIKVVEADGTEHLFTTAKTVFNNEANTIIKRELLVKDKKVLLIAKTDTDLTPALLIVSLDQ